MPSGMWTWSQTAATNQNSDSAIGWSEGQAPSTVNDSARAMMAVLAKWRDDISGATVTGGSSTAYTLSTFSAFDSLAHMSGNLVGFTPHTTNGATVTLNCDSLGAKPLRPAPGVELFGGELIEGTPYCAVYDNSDQVWYLQGGIGNPNAYSIPLGSGIDFWGDTAPSSIFAFPYGQAISRSIYSSLYTLFGTKYGSGDGSTTFNLPDCRGRFVAKKDNMGGTGAGRMQSGNGGVDGATLGASGGADTKTLTASQIPSITSSVSVSVSGSCAVVLPVRQGGESGVQINDAVQIAYSNLVSVGNIGPAGTFSGTGSGSATSNNTSGAAHSIMPPTIVANYILRVA